MEKMKQIMYGVTDFALMRAENGYFVDRTRSSSSSMATTSPSAIRTNERSL